MPAKSRRFHVSDRQEDDHTDRWTNVTTRAAFDVSGSFMAETLTLAGLPIKGAPGARRRLATGDFCHRNWRQQPFQVECSLAAMLGGGLGGKGIYI